MDDAHPTGTPRADKRAAAGEAWTDEMTDEMDIALWCGTCFDAARRINGVET
jgi:hypothetical protein